EEAWDSAQATADKEGHFGFAGLPSELYSLGVKVNGYHLSPKNVSIDLFGFSLLGVVCEDIAGLRLLLEPGPAAEREQRSAAEFYQEYNRRRREPLRGAPEGKPEAAPGRQGSKGS